MSNAIPQETFLKGGRGSQHEGQSEDPDPNDLSVGDTRLRLDFWANGQIYLHGKNVMPRFVDHLPVLCQW
jgi:hypothetical protein